MTARSALPLTVPDSPRVTVVLHSDGSGTVNGRRIRISADTDPRTVLMTEACRFAVTLGRPVRVEAHDPDGVWDLVAHPDGSVTAGGKGSGGRRLRRPTLQRRDRGPAAAGTDADPIDDATADPVPAPTFRPVPPRASSAPTGTPTPDDESPTWHQASQGPTRPRPGAGPGLAPPADSRRRPARPEPVVWSG